MTRSSFPVVLLLATAAVGTHAAPLVSAHSSSLAQGGPQPASSHASIQDGVPGYVFAGPNGSAEVGPIGAGVTSAWAATSQIDGALLTTSSAYADLASGTLRNSVQAPGGPGAGASVGVANSRWVDTVTFDNTSGQTLELGLSWQTDGVVTPSSPVGWYSMNVTSSIELSVDNTNFSAITFKDANLATGGLGGAQFNYGTFGQAGSAYWSFAPAGNDLEQAWTTTLLDPSSGVLSATLLVPTGLSSIRIDAKLLVDCRSGALCDFGHTATFGFGALPEGLSWQSDSGVFLTAAVPEPASYALFGAGLALIGWARRAARNSVREGRHD